MGGIRMVGNKCQTSVVKKGKYRMIVNLNHILERIDSLGLSARSFNSFR